MSITIDLNKLDNIDKYLKVVTSMLNEVKTKIELDDIVKLIISVEKKYKYFHRDDNNIYKDIALTLRGFIKSVIFGGNLPDRDYLYLYVIFNNLEIDIDEGLNSQIPILKDSLNHLEDNSIEKIITNETIFLIEILNTNTKNGFENYLKEILIFKSNLTDIESTREFIIEFFYLLNLNFEDIKSLLSELFEKDFYLNLSYEKQRSICNWSLHVIYNLNNFFTPSKWANFYPKWKEIFYKYLKDKEVDRALYFQFFIYHFMGNSFQDNSEWKVFNEEINIPASRVYKKWGEDNSLIKPKEKINRDKKIKIALLMDRISFNSQFKVEFSILKALSLNEEFNKKYEIAIYSANYFEKSMDNIELIESIKGLNINFYSPANEFMKLGYYNSHLDKSLKIRETLINDEIDILITNMNGQGINTFLLANRCATKQVYFGHGELHFNIDGIDNRMTMGSVDEAQEQIIEGFKVQVYKNIVDIDFLNPVLNEIELKEIKDIKNNYPKNTIYLGTIGRLVKLDNREYIKIVLNLLKKYSNTVYLACGIGGESNIKELIQEVNKEISLENLEDRFIFTGLVNAHIYGNIIDIFLNTFPQSQGTSLLEIMAKGKVVISMYLKDWEEINKLVPKESIINSIDEYEELSAKAISNRKTYNKLSKLCKNSALNYANLDESAKSIVKIFDKIIED